MATRAVVDIMPFGQWEEIVIDPCGTPLKRCYCVAFLAFGRKACSLVVRVCSAVVCILMTGYTLRSDQVKAQISIGDMAFKAVDRRMCSEQWK